MSIDDVLAYIGVMARELWIHKFKVFFLGAMVGLAILVMGIFWPVKYEVETTIKAANKAIIAGIVKDVGLGGVEDQVRVVRDGMMSSKIINEAIRTTYEGGEELSPEDLEGIAALVRSNLAIASLGTDFIKISYVDNSAQSSFDMINNVTDIFIRERSSSRRDESRKTFEFIERQVKRLKDQLVEAEERVKQFKASNFDGTEQEVGSKINRLKNEIEELNLESADIRARISTLNSQLNDEGRYISGNIYRDQIAALQQERSNLLLSVTESHPDVIKITYQIQDAKAQLSKSTERSSNDPVGTSVNPLHQQLRAELAGANRDLNSKVRRLGSTEKILSQEYERRKRIAARAAELSEITRDYDTTKDNYESMLDRLENARLNLSVSTDTDGITYQIQEAPAFPIIAAGLRFQHFAILGLIFAALVPLGAIFAYVFIDPRLRFVGELKDSIPESSQLLAVIPHELSMVGKRIIRKDILFLTLLAVLFLTAYIGISIAFSRGTLSV